MKRIKDVQIKRLDTPSRYRGLKVVLLLLGIVVLWIFLMNYLSTYVHRPKDTDTHRVAGGLDYELRIDKSTYGVGQPIRLRLIVRNVSPDAVVLHFPSTQRYNFAVKRDLDFIFFHFPVDVWQSSYGRISHPVKNTLVLKPHEEKIFEEVWNQKDARGKQVSPGRFIISAWLTISGEKTILELPTRMRK